MPAVMEAIGKMTTAEKVEVMNYLWVAVASAGERESSLFGISKVPRMR